MRISDWSSDVCSSDLRLGQRPLLGVEVDAHDHVGAGQPGALDDVEADAAQPEHDDVRPRLDLGRPDDRADAGRHAAADVADQIGSASCRERVCQYVSISVVAVSLKKKTITPI